MEQYPPTPPMNEFWFADEVSRCTIANTYFVALVATVGGMLFGFDISSMSAIVIQPQYIDFFDNPSGVRQGAIGSALAAGSVFGSLIAGPISNKWGRRDSIAFACLWWLAGTAVQTAVNGFGMLVAGRVLNGVCVGITSAQVPVYLAEIAKKVRLSTLWTGILGTAHTH